MTLRSARSESSASQGQQEKSIVWLPGLCSDRARSETMSAKREQTELKLAKWPFLLGDALLLAAAYVVCSQSTRPMGLWQVGLVVLCVAGGACLSITPFLLEYRVLARLAEAWAPTAAVEQLQEPETEAAEITAGQAQGHEAHEEEQEEVSKTAAATEGIAGSMGAEVQGSTELMQPINDSEKASLLLEVEKLRRQEGDWLQVLVRMLDHVYALEVGALRSGQPNLIEQVSNFQDACRDVARRIGLKPFIAEPGERFDAQRHQRDDGEDPAPAEATVAETIATGYTFQGRLLRPALVRLVKSAGAESAEGQMGDILPGRPQPQE
jgi:molecular chaperone GrpE (heat shock protein)